ncbi:unnamed protein product [Sympodiomycopsis kandeliae]
MTDKSPQDATVLYKILTPSQYESLPRDDPAVRWPGVGIDLADGFIHLSTASQLAGTLERFFTDAGDTLWISAISVQRIRDQKYQLKWEPAAGTLFGHIYNEVCPAVDFHSHVQVNRGPDGKFVLPSLTF